MKPTYHPNPKKRKANNSALAYWSKPQNSLTNFFFFLSSNNKLKQRKKLIKENQPRETNIGHQQPQTTH